MSRRIFIISIIAVIIIGIAGFSYYYKSVGQKAVSEGKPAPTLKEFFPFLGNNSTTTPPTTTTNTGETPPPINSQNPDTLIAPKLKQLTTRAIAGATTLLAYRNSDGSIVTNATSTTATPFPVARYLERSSGHIYETFIDKIAEMRVSNTTIPRVEEALFGKGGESVILRYLKDDERTIETWTGTLGGAVSTADASGISTLKELTGTFLPENISNLVVSPDGTRIFYILPTADGIVGTSANIDGSLKKQVFLSSFSEWLPDWPKTTMLTVTTKASGAASGYMYTVDPISGIFTKILGNISGLTTEMSPSGDKMIYGISKQNGVALFLYDLTSRASTPLGVNTLPEKCTWNSTGSVIYCGVPQTIPDGLYPDTWYQGVASFTDSIWKIDVGTHTTAVLMNPVQALGDDLDITTPFLDTSGQYLLFTNKKDSTLWSYDLGL